MSRHRILAAVFVVCITANSISHAQEKDPWLGKQVMVTQSSAELKAGEETIGSARLGEFFSVKKVQGDWLWIESRKGWIDRGDVVLLDQAADHFTKKIQQNPSGETYHQRAVMWISLKKFKEAVADFDNAIKQDSENVSLYNDRGNALRKTGQLDRAMTDFNEAIRRELNHPAVYTNRGLVWFSMGKTDQALEDFSTAIKLDQKYAPAWEAGGTARQAQGNFAKAARNYNNAISADPNFHMAHNNLAWLLATCQDASIRDGKKSVEHATRACELTDFQDPGFLDTLAAAHAEAGDFTKAIERSTQAIQLAGEKEIQALADRLALYQEKKPYRMSRLSTAKNPVPPAP